MKLKYVGHKNFITVTLPVGAKKKFIKEKINLQRNIAVEIEDAEAQKLLLLNPNGNYEVVTEGKAVKETPVEVAATLAIKEETHEEKKEEPKAVKKPGKPKKA